MLTSKIRVYARTPYTVELSQVLLVLCSCKTKFVLCTNTFIKLTDSLKLILIEYLLILTTSRLSNWTSCPSQIIRQILVRHDRDWCCLGLQSRRIKSSFVSTLWNSRLICVHDWRIIRVEIIRMLSSWKMACMNVAIFVKISFWLKKSPMLSRV